MDDFVPALNAITNEEISIITDDDRAGVTNVRPGSRGVTGSGC